VQVRKKRDWIGEISTWIACGSTCRKRRGGRGEGEAFRNEGKKKGDRYSHPMPRLWLKMLTIEIPREGKGKMLMKKRRIKGERKKQMKSKEPRTTAGASQGEPSCQCMIVG